MSYFGCFANGMILGFGLATALWVILMIFLEVVKPKKKQDKKLKTEVKIWYLIGQRGCGLFMVFVL